MTTRYPAPDTYGRTDPSPTHAICNLCSPELAGWKVVRRATPGGHTDTVQPCPACAPVPFARWQAGHLGCRRPSCEVCTRIDGTQMDAPATGGSRWLDD